MLKQISISKSKIMRLYIFVSSLLLILLFQNCAEHGFDATNLENSSSASSDNNEADPESPTGEPPVVVPPPGTPPPMNGNTYLLYIAKAGAGTVTSLPAGINCGADCSEWIERDQMITLTALASSSYTFKGWSGACSGSNPTCTLKMSAARNVNVQFESNSQEGTIDAIIAAMPSNSWKSLANTQMKDACPIPYSSYACGSVIAAWSGGAYDEARDRMIVIGGGHGDSWYNNVFAFDLATMQWSRLNEMPENSGNKPPQHWYDIRVEPCGFYPKGPLNIPPEFMDAKNQYIDSKRCSEESIASQLDFQQPRSTHSYGRVYVDKVKDLYCYISLGTFPSAQTATNVVHCLNPSTGIWERSADRPNGVAGRGQTALDSKNHLWAITDASGSIGEYNPYTNTWATHGYVNAEAGGGTDIDRKRDQLYVLFPLGATSHSLRKFDIANPSNLNKRPSFTEVAGTGDIPPFLGNRPGFVYADSKDKFYVWGGGRDVYTFNPETREWKRNTPTTGDDPGVQSNWGTYGRFRYSVQRGVFVVVNSITQNVFIYKP